MPLGAYQYFPEVEPDFFYLIFGKFWGQFQGQFWGQFHGQFWGQFLGQFLGQFYATWGTPVVS